MEYDDLTALQEGYQVRITSSVSQHGTKYHIIFVSHVVCCNVTSVLEKQCPMKRSDGIFSTVEGTTEYRRTTTTFQKRTLR